MAQPIRKAVFPVAGLGTRFLPATKAMPKEMLTVVDRPLIQHVVDEALEAGIEHFIFVTGRNKGVIEDHFDKQVELEQTLEARDKTEALEELARDLLAPGQVSFTRQQSPRGLGHAVWCARHLVGNEPFALLLPDVLVRAEKSCLAQMAESYQKHGGNIIAVEKVAPQETHQYGIVALGEAVDAAHRITGMVEKPEQGTAPSNLMILGRYILQPKIFDILADQEAGAGGEVQLTDAMLKLMERQDFYALAYEGQSYDCGNKVGFLVANIAFALDRPDIRGPLLEALRDMMQEDGGGR